MAAPVPPTLGPSPTGGNPSAAAARALVARLQETVKAAISTQRPWSELTDRSTFAKPESVNDALTRIRKNLGYFRSNYLTVLFSVVVVSMLWNVNAIFWLALLTAVWLYVFFIRVEPIVISGRTLADREKFLALAAISIFIVFGLTSVGSVLISGVIVGSAAICVHAAFRVPDDLFLDDNDGAGFLSFLGTQPTTLGV